MIKLNLSQQKLAQLKNTYNRFATYYLQNNFKKGEFITFNLLISLGLGKFREIPCILLLLLLLLLLLVVVVVVVVVVLTWFNLYYLNPAAG